MHEFRIHLSTRNEQGGTSLLTLDEGARGAAAGSDGHHRRRLERAYREYLADPRWLPARPVSVALTGSVRHRDAASRKPPGYELSFFGSESTAVRSRMERRLSQGLVALATAASVVIPISRAAHGLPSTDNGSAPPSADYSGSPPTTLLSTPNAARAGLGQQVNPLKDERGRPIILAAFHQNTPGTPHSNVPTSHTNVWSNHANTMTPHTNAWSNHSNVPGYTIPHTNVVPGDLIF